MICDWWISIRFVCFYVSSFVACDRNYERTAANNVIVKATFELQGLSVFEKRSKGDIGSGAINVAVAEISSSGVWYCK